MIEQKLKLNVLNEMLDKISLFEDMDLVLSRLNYINNNRYVAECFYFYTFESYLEAKKFNLLLEINNDVKILEGYSEDHKDFNKWKNEITKE